MMDKDTAVEILRNGQMYLKHISNGKCKEIADFIEQQETKITSLMQIIESQKETNLAIVNKVEQQAKQIESMKEILGDVLSDCYLSDGMRSEIERRI